MIVTNHLLIKSMVPFSFIYTIYSDNNQAEFLSYFRITSWYRSIKKSKILFLFFILSLHYISKFCPTLLLISVLKFYIFVCEVVRRDFIPLNSSTLIREEAFQKRKKWMVE